MSTGKVKSEVPSARTGEKLVLRWATGTGKLPGSDENWSAACDRYSKTGIFSPPPCHSNKQETSPVRSPTGEAGKNAETMQFHCGGLRFAPKENKGMQRIKFRFI
jgi:hypothetical protein